MAKRSTATAARILEATKDALVEMGYADLSTRAIAERAEVPLSQIHYHFGSKQQLVLALLDDENTRRFQRQVDLYGDDEAPLSVQWDRACDFLEDDLDSGYVRVLQEMMAVAWSDEDVAARIRASVSGWLRLLTDVAEQFAREHGDLGPFTPAEIATLAGVAFLGAEELILLGFREEQVPNRSALRRVGDLIRAAERTPEVV